MDVQNFINFINMYTYLQQKGHQNIAHGDDVMHVLQDNVIFERLNEGSQYKDLTVAHLEQFATEGEQIYMHHLCTLSLTPFLMCSGFNPMRVFSSSPS